MIAVIGDVHGCYNTLKELVNRIKNKYPGTTIYSVGDLVDRGKYSCEVIDYIINENIKFTPGNHDYMFLYYFENPSSSIAKLWMYNGCEMTISSYSGREGKIKEHLENISREPLFFNIEEAFISHAGISKSFVKYLPKDFKENKSALMSVLEKHIANEDGILWTRDELVNFGKMQVVGHTRRNDVFFSSANNALYIDTSVYTGNKLSAVVIEPSEILDTISIPTKPEDLY